MRFVGRKYFLKIKNRVICRVQKQIQKLFWEISAHREQYSKYFPSPKLYEVGNSYYASDEPETSMAKSMSIFGRLATGKRKPRFGSSLPLRGKCEHTNSYHPYPPQDITPQPIALLQLETQKLIIEDKKEQISNLELKNQQIMSLTNELASQKLRNKDLQLQFLMQKYEESMQLNQIFLKNGMENAQTSSLQLTQKTITFTHEQMITNE